MSNNRNICENEKYVFLYNIHIYMYVYIYIYIYVYIYTYIIIIYFLAGLFFKGTENSWDSRRQKETSLFIFTTSTRSRSSRYLLATLQLR